jgi:hypothetical protein
MKRLQLDAILRKTKEGGGEKWLVRTSCGGWEIEEPTKEKKSCDRERKDG